MACLKNYYWFFCMAIIGMCSAISWINKCSSKPNPCRISHYLADNIAKTSLPSCLCKENNTCPTRSKVPGQTLTFKKKNGVTDILVDYNYCKPVASKNIRTCTAGKVAVKMSGLGVMAVRLNKLNCVCANDGPLYVLETKSVRGHKLTQTHTCEMRTCSASDVSSEVCTEIYDYRAANKSGRWMNKCFCPEGLMCWAKVMKIVPWGYFGYGYCLPLESTRGNVTFVE